MTPSPSVNVVIDIGSSGIRAVAFSLQGKVLAWFKQDSETFYPRPGWAEQDPHEWETASLACLTRLVKALPRGTHINGLSVTGQCPSYLPVDEDIRPLGNVLTYQDNRSLQEAGELAALVGVEYIHDRSGHGIEPFFILPKLLWHKKHMPDLFERIHKVLQPADYLEYFLTGSVCTDHACACGTLAYDRHTRGWNFDLLRNLGIDEGIFPNRILESWDVVDELKESLAESTGLPRDLKIIRGGPDSQCCALGVNAIETDVLSNMSGTSTCLNRTLPEPMPDPRVGNYAHVVPGCWSAEVGLNTTGVSLKKVSGILFSGLDEKMVYHRVNACLEKSPAGSNGLLFFPYLSNGERDNQDVKGGFYNLSMINNADDMVRSVMEGVAFAEKERADLLLSDGDTFSAMRISGGGASSDQWCQIKADVMNIPVSALKDVDAAELGASLLVSVGAGVVGSLEEAIGECQLRYSHFEPKPLNAAVYAETYANFTAFERTLSQPYAPTESTTGSG